MRWKSVCLLSFVSVFASAEVKEQALDNLLPYFQFKAEEEQTYLLEDRMAYYDVPGVSITLFDKGEILWTHTQGAKNKAGEPVEQDTAFQVASISKPVAALLVLKAVDEGKITLDEDVRRLLIPELQEKAVYPVSLRQLLTHTGGFAMSGLPGFTRGEHYPSPAQVVTGEYGATPFDQQEPSGDFLYSNPGFLLVQSVLESLYDKPIKEIAQEKFWQPLGLENISYEQKHAEYQGMDLAHGSQYGHWLLGDWNRHTIQAAAGLWTSTPDLARLLLTVYQSLSTDNPNFVRAETLSVIREPSHPFMGLTFYRHSDENGEYLFHGGINKGYESHFVLYPELGSGAVIATNGQGGDALALEIMRSLSRYYQWPNYQLNLNYLEGQREQNLSQYVGRYHYSEDFYADIIEKQGRLYVHGKGQFRYPLQQVGEGVFTAVGFVSDFEFKSGWFSDEITSLVQKAPDGDYSADKE